MRKPRSWASSMALSPDDLAGLEAALRELLTDVPVHREGDSLLRLGPAAEAVVATARMAASKASRARVEHWDALGAICDRIGGGVRVYSLKGNGAEVDYQNPRLAEFLAADRERKQLDEAMTSVGQALLGAAGPFAPRVQIATKRAQYLIAGTALARLPGGPERAVVTTRMLSGPVNASAQLERVRRRYQLTNAEARVAALVARGLRNAEIARQLGISPHTARHHTDRIRRKFGVDSRAKVVALFLAE